MKDSLLNILLDKSEEIMSEDKMYHDFAHAKNVYQNAKALLNKLGGDEVIVLTSALFHDIARDSENHEEKGAEMLREILDNIEDFPKTKIDEVCLAVLHHEKGQESLNEKILSDADKIDAFNVLAIGRGFMMSASKGLKLRESIPLYLDLLEQWYENFYFEESRGVVEEDYKSTKEILFTMLEMYK